jgi:hypothetical protein
MNNENNKEEIRGNRSVYVAEMIGIKRRKQTSSLACDLGMQAMVIV